MKRNRSMMHRLFVLCICALFAIFSVACGDDDDDDDGITCSSGEIEATFESYTQCFATCSDDADCLGEDAECRDPDEPDEQVCVVNCDSDADCGTDEVCAAGICLDESTVNGGFPNNGDADAGDADARDAGMDSTDGDDEDADGANGDADGETDAGDGERVLTCYDLNQCMSLCESGDDDCREANREEASQVELTEFDAVLSCADENCSDAQNYELCVEDNCSSQLETCFGSPPTDAQNLTCSEVLNCATNCPDDECAEQCEMRGSDTGIQQLNDYLSCIDANECPEADDSDACIEQNCLDEFNSCFGCP